MTEELKNCPVCNSSNVIPYYQMDAEPNERAYVWCRTCRTPGPKCQDWHEQHRLWNAIERKPAPPALASLALTEGEALAILQVEVSILRAANEQLRNHFHRFEMAELKRNQRKKSLTDA